MIGSRGFWSTYMSASSAASSSSVSSGSRSLNSLSICSFSGSGVAMRTSPKWVIRRDRPDYTETGDIARLWLPGRLDSNIPALPNALSDHAPWSVIAHRLLADFAHGNLELLRGASLAACPGGANHRHRRSLQYGAD